MAVILTKIVLLRDGLKGINVDGIFPREKTGLTVKVEVSGMKYPIPVPYELKNLFQRGRRYLLHVCGLWDKSYDQYYKKGQLVEVANPDETYYKVVQLIQNTRMTGIARNNGKYVLTGSYINEWKMVVALKTPGINVEVQYDDYPKLDKYISIVMEKYADFIVAKELAKQNAKQFALDFNEGDSKTIEELEALGEKELEAYMIRKLEEGGALVLQNSDMEEMSDKKEEVPELDENPPMTADQEVPDKEPTAEEVYGDGKEEPKGEAEVSDKKEPITDVEEVPEI